MTVRKEKKQKKTDNKWLGGETTRNVNLKPNQNKK